MPFGDKVDFDGKLIDFNKIYTYLIKNTVEGLGIKCVKCGTKSPSRAGFTQKCLSTFINQIVAITDITSLNPNVLYELGVRHALAESVTVLLRRKGTAIPFNIQGFQVIEYDPEDIASVEEAKKKVVVFIKNGLKLKKKDSPVHEVLEFENRH